MRRIYIDILRERLARADLPFLAKIGLRYPLIHLSHILRHPLCGPILGTLIVTYRCNYNCVMCDMPSIGQGQSHGREEELNTEEMMGMIDQLSDLGTLGIGFTGGEPLLRNDLMKLLQHARETGMLTHLNTNGSLLDGSVIKELVALGVDSLNISLDGASARTHDRIRGVPGAWEAAISAAGEVIRIRGEGKKPRLKMVMVVDRANMEEVPAMVDLAVDLGVECIEFIPVQPFKEFCSRQSVAGSDGFAKSVGSALREAVKRARGRLSIENSPRMMSLFSPAFRGDPSPVKCFAGYNSLAVDCYGQVFPCLPWVNWSRPAGRIRERSLNELWRSEDYAEVRRKVHECRECTLNCQAELNLLFQPLRSFRG